MRKLLVALAMPIVLAAQAAPELVVSVGHASIADHAEFLASGHLLTASSSDVAIIDLTSGLTVGHLPQGALVMAMQASPRGDLMAVGSCGHAIKLWNVKSRRLERQMTVTAECVESVSFSSDGAFLATQTSGCCGRRGLQVWDVQSGKLVRELGTGSRFQRVVFSGDDSWVAGVEENTTASVFEWPSGRLLRTLEGFSMAGYSGSTLIASRDGRYLALVAVGHLRVVDARSGGEVPVPEANRDGIFTAEFLNDGRLAFIHDAQMVARQLPDGPSQVVRLEREVIGDVSFDTSQTWLKIRRDGLLIAGNRQSGAVVWEVAPGRLRPFTSPPLAMPKSLRWSHVGLIAWADDGVRAWDDRLGRLIALGTNVDSAASIAFRSDGARVAVSGWSSSMPNSGLYIIDVASRRAMFSRDIGLANFTGVAFSPDGSLLAFAADNRFEIVDSRLRPQKQITSLPQYTTPEYVAFSPDGRWIAAGLSGPQPGVTVWPVAGSTDPIVLDTGRLTYGPQPLAFTGDSQFLASFSRGESLMIWSTATWSLARTWKLPGTGRALAFAPNGSALAIAADDEAAIWDPVTGQKLVTFSTPGSTQFQEIAWSPDGRRIVTTADDGVLHFWRASNGQLLASLYVLETGADWLLVSPDGRIDGSQNALARLVAWRVGDRVALDRVSTEQRRTPRLWRAVSTSTSR